MTIIGTASPLSDPGYYPTATEVGVYTGTLTASDLGYSNKAFDLYCVDLLIAIGTGYSYDATITDDGIVGSIGGEVPNGQQVVYLLETFGTGTLSDDERLGLQAAIWRAEYDTAFELVAPGGTSTTTQDTWDAYLTYKAAIGGTKPVTDALWISPVYGFPYQGLVALDTESTTGDPVPEPTSFVVMFGLGVGFFVSAARRRKSR